MKCKDLHSNLLFYFEGNENDSFKIEIEKHLAECSDCYSYANFLKEQLCDLDKLKAIESSKFLYTRVKMQLENHAPKQQKVFWLQPAIITLIVVISFISGIGIANSFWNKYEANNSDSNSIITAYSTESVEYALLQNQE